jgi:hypothetical protein
MQSLGCRGRPIEQAPWNNPGLGKIGGLMVKAIARLLDVPFGTVLARLHRGRKRFEQELWTYAEDTRLLPKGTVR